METTIKNKCGSVELRKQHGRNLIFRHYQIKAHVDESNKKPVRFGEAPTPVNGHVCVVLKRPDKGDTSGKFQAAVAFGSPMDEPNKRIARDIATGRLFSSRPGRNFNFTVSPGNAEGQDLDYVFSIALDKAVDPDFVVEKNHQQVLYAPKWIHEALADGFDFC